MSANVGMVPNGQVVSPQPSPAIPSASSGHLETVNGVCALVTAVINAAVLFFGPNGPAERLRPLLCPTRISEFVKAAEQDRIVDVRGMIGRVDINGTDERGWSALERAAAFGRLQVVEELLARGAEVNKRVACGRTAIMQTSRNGFSNIVNLLLDRTANIDMADNDGWTSLMLAAWQGKAEVVHTLIRRGADRNLRNNNGQTARAIATEFGHREIVQILA